MRVSSSCTFSQLEIPRVLEREAIGSCLGCWEFLRCPTWVLIFIHRGFVPFGLIRKMSHEIRGGDANGRHHRSMEQLP